MLHVYANYMLYNRMFLRLHLKLVLLLLAVSVLAACNDNGTQEVTDGQGRTVKRVVLAEVEGSSLYKDELDYLVISKNHLTDSAEFADEYINLWAMDELFYNKAKANIASSEEIERMVDDYRKNLILNIYQDALVNQHLKPAISEGDIEIFYNENSALFKADEVLLKGIVMKLPERSPKMAQVRRWCASLTPDNVEKLEMYCDEYSATLDYFVDEWQRAGRLATKTPLTGKQLETRLQQSKAIEFKQDGYVYFVTADSIIRKGELLPMTHVKDDITELLINSRRADFIKAKKKELYEDAVADGKIKIHNN